MNAMPTLFPMLFLNLNSLFITLNGKINKPFNKPFCEDIQYAQFDRHSSLAVR